MLKQQSCAPPSYPSRAPVDDPTDWSDASYRPNEYEAPVLSSGVDWADKPTCAAKEIGDRLTFSAAGDFSQSVAEACELDETLQRYRNPKGKTGIKGRGLLGKFGPNHAVDTIVTRCDQATGKLQGLVIDRVDGDGTTLAWPGGMINPGDDASITVRKEFTEEAVKEGAVVDRLFSECKEGVVYRGFVDDHRNTDIAWMETTAVHYHCTSEIGAGLTLEIKDTHEVTRVAWKNLDEIDAMYASHYDWLCTVRESLPAIIARRTFMELVRSNPTTEWAVAFKQAGFEMACQGDLEPPTKKRRA